MCEMQKCPICGELIKKGNGHHIKKCMDNFIDNLSEDKKNEYVSLYNSGVSIYELSTILNFSYNATVKFLKKIGITKFRTISEQKLTDHTKNKAKQTYLKHYGCEHNFCKNSESRKEWEQRLLDTEGITNVFQRESVKQKSKETLLKNYGKNAKQYVNSKEHYFEKWLNEGYTLDDCEKMYKELCYKRGNSMRLSYYIEKYGNNMGYEKYKSLLLQIAQRSKTSRTISSLNIRIFDLLDSLNIKYEYEFPLETEVPGKFLYYDIKIKNYIFELQGDYWHASPLKYKANDIVHYPNNVQYTAQFIWDKDKYKKNVAEFNGYTVFYIWEHDMNNKDKWEFIKKCFKRYAEIENNWN